MGGVGKILRVEGVLEKNQICYIVKKWFGGVKNWELVHTEMKPAACRFCNDLTSHFDAHTHFAFDGECHHQNRQAAADGIAGFLGDHFRVTLKVSCHGRLVTIPLFIKCIPLNNAPKAEFISTNHFYAKEMVVFKLIEEMEIEGPNPFVARALFYNESILVMRDLTSDNYTTRNQMDTFDLPHVLVTLTSLARFHAAVANFETKKSVRLHHPFSVMEEHGQLFEENNFKDTPWLRAGAKLASNVIQHLSEKYRNAIPDSETKLLKQFLAACDDLMNSKDTLKVVLHNDLWMNNIMFKYDNGVPTNSILLDFQCVRYGPPTFDVMFFLHQTTSRRFREQNEAVAIRHYFKIFTESLDEHTKARLKCLLFDWEDFLRWVHVSRKYGVLAAIIQLPYVLMDQGTANVTFNDPATFEKVTKEDRSAPVLAYALKCPAYGERLLEAVKEFVERYLSGQ